MTKVRIQLVPNYREVLGNNLGVQATLRARAEGAKQAARSTAPVATGAYRDSIDVQGTDLVATDFKANWIEFGTIRTRAHATLRSAARLFANRLREG